MSSARILGLAAAGGTAFGALAGWLSVVVFFPPLVRRSGHYGSRAGRCAR